MQRFTDGSDGFIEVEDGRIVNIGVKYAGGNDQARTNHHAAIARGVMWIQAAAAPVAITWTKDGREWRASNLPEGWSASALRYPTPRDSWELFICRPDAENEFIHRDRIADLKLLLTVRVKQAAAALQAQQEASEVEQAPTRRRGTVTNGIATLDAAVEQAQEDAYQDNEARRIGLI